MQREKNLNEKSETEFCEKVCLLKIAQEAAEFSQCAQYDYHRLLENDDEVTASIMLSDGIRHAMRLAHYISNECVPNDKWLYKSTGELPFGAEMISLIDKVMCKDATNIDRKKATLHIQKLAAFLAKKMYEHGIISDINSCLDFHTEEIIFKANICELTSEELVDKIVELEFEAFDKVKNEGGRADCQNDWQTFSVMRKSQYLTWNHEMLMQYYYDFSREYKMGHNLITEKYGRMMESTNKEKWEEIKDNFPRLSEEKEIIIEQIVDIQVEMMEEFAIEHPKTAGNARSIHTYDDNTVNTSYETYLRGEISTYSDKMLQLYGRYVVSNLKNGINIAKAIMENTAKLYGFKNIDEFENINNK